MCQQTSAEAEEEAVGAGAAVDAAAAAAVEIDELVLAGDVAAVGGVDGGAAVAEEVRPSERIHERLHAFPTVEEGTDSCAATQMMSLGRPQCWHNQDLETEMDAGMVSLWKGQP